MTATVETVSEQLDLAAIMPTEKVMSAAVRTVTLSETDLGESLIVSYYIVFFDHSKILFKIIL